MEIYLGQRKGQEICLLFWSITNGTALRLGLGRRDTLRPPHGLCLSVMSACLDDMCSGPLSGWEALGKCPIDFKISFLESLSSLQTTQGGETGQQRGWAHTGRRVHLEVSHNQFRWAGPESPSAVLLSKRGMKEVAICIESRLWAEQASIFWELIMNRGKLNEKWYVISEREVCYFAAQTAPVWGVWPGQSQETEVSDRSPTWVQGLKHLDHHVVTQGTLTESCIGNEIRH